MMKWALKNIGLILGGMLVLAGAASLETRIDDLVQVSKANSSCQMSMEKLMPQMPAFHDVKGNLGRGCPPTGVVFFATRKTEGKYDD